MHLGCSLLCVESALLRPKSVDLLRRVSPTARIFLDVVVGVVTAKLFLLSHASTSAPFLNP